MDNKKILVAYFSCSGVTRKVAESLAQAAEADLYEIEPEIPYKSADLNWNDKNSRSTIEMKDLSSRPVIATNVSNMEQYDTVLIGFPVWWYVAPTIINTFIESYDFAGKNIVLFATSGGSGLGKSQQVLEVCCSKSAKWLTGKILSGRASVSELKIWVNSLQI